MMGYQLSAPNYSHLTIVRRSPGKYYKLLTDDELRTELLTGRSEYKDIVLATTRAELDRIAPLIQSALKLDYPPDD